MPETTFHQETEVEAEAPTLIEGLPGMGLVASIATDHVTSHLGLERHGTIRSDEFPATASFSDGLLQDTVRVYAGSDPDVMTLQSDVPLPEPAFSELSECVLDELAPEFERAIFMAGEPAASEEQRGDVVGVATTPDLRDELAAAGVEVLRDSGAVSGATGALATACYHNDVPAALLLVRVQPRLPDPGAARAVIENALEPIVDFDVDTHELEEQAEQIQQEKQRVLQQIQQEQPEESTQSEAMFQ